eukprot:gnl/TRDRNA2_/TRDRNA2_80485_c0_seq1.p1 gnl/TRDRNA2_/TRDRNA2_80485_c0~~gnl/TRDRNA2_/TRDRNA2_80485_c0_seq1.p1  ORF type:complete len:317 (+),score=41.10 gnl/TRDRNA2_/TRDRNA2_80485_c0_seq1:81-1031(+)
MKLAATTMILAPMLSLLFLATTMRAREVTGGSPQPWAETSMHVCTLSVVVQLVLVITAPYLTDAELISGPVGEVNMHISNKGMFAFISACRWMAMLSLYASTAVVLFSSLTIADDTGTIPPFSPALRCVGALTVMYFGVYLSLWSVITWNQLVDGELLRLVRILSAAKDTVMLSPMLAIIFVGARLHAFDLKGEMGAPQGWVQTLMYVTTLALLLQLVFVVLSNLLSPIARTHGEADPAMPDPFMPKFERVPTGAAAASVLQYVCMIIIYACTMALILGIFLMDLDNVHVGPGLLPGEHNNTMAADGTVDIPRAYS